MKNTIFNKRLWIIAGIILIASISRILPHLPNFTPVVAMALFGGIYLHDKRFAILVPLLVMFISDLFIGMHSTMIYVYISIILIGIIGMAFHNKLQIFPLVIATFFSSVLFFIITNFGVWISENIYPRSIYGLFLCYEAAIPFFRNSLLGDFFYITMLVGTFELIKFRKPAMVKS